MPMCGSCARARTKDNHLSLLVLQDIMSYLISRSLAGLLRGSRLCWKLGGSDKNSLRCMLAVPLRFRTVIWGTPSTALILLAEAARYITNTSPLIGALLRALKNGSDLSAPFERNRLSAVSFPLRLCISLNIFGGLRSVIALTFDGLDLIPCLVMRCPKNGPSSMPKEHFFGLSFILIDQSQSKVSWMSSSICSSKALLITMSLMYALRFPLI
ncbi:hypothetical protein Tco_0520313 [Tanacetum coccineum]